MNGVPKAIRKSLSDKTVEFCSKKKAKTAVKPKYEAKKPSFRREKVPGFLNKKKNNAGDDFLSLKQAKHDVFKYGIKGFNKEQQETTNIQLAIKLGAAVS